jgi:glycosyltransferase involved in cell wall biosynthesis
MRVALPPPAVSPGLRELEDRDFRLLYDNEAKSATGYRLSIVAPNYNRGRLLMNMLDSIRSQICDFQVIEMLIVDDGGAAGEVETIKAQAWPFRLRYYWQPHQGRRPGRVRNFGIRQAQGEIILFLDSDILASRHLIQDHLDKHGHCRHIAVIGDLEALGPGESGTFWRHFGCDARFPHPATFAWHWLKREWLIPWKYRMIRKSPGLACCSMHVSAQKDDLLAINGFNDDFDGRWADEDLDLGCRLVRSGVRFRWSGKSFVFHQWHPVSFQAAILDNRLKLFLQNPETLKARTISGLENPFRVFSLEALRRCHEEEEAEAVASRPGSGSPDSCLVFDNHWAVAALPELSLVIPVANQAPWLEDFLDGLERQTLDPEAWEVVIADNGSTDNTGKIIAGRPRPFRLRHIRQEISASPGSHRNLGIRAARGALIVMTGVNAFLPDHFLETHAQQHKGHPGMVLIGGKYSLGRAEALPAAAGTRKSSYSRRFKQWIGDLRRNYLARLGSQAFAALGSTLHCSFQRQDFECIGGFDEGFEGPDGFEDADFFCRLEESGRNLVWLDAVTPCCRWTPERERTEEACLLFLVKHPFFLQQRMIGNRLNGYYNQSHLEVRCRYVWARRLRRLGSRRSSGTAMEIALAQLRALAPVLIDRWKQAGQGRGSQPSPPAPPGHHGRTHSPAACAKEIL